VRDYSPTRSSLDEIKSDYLLETPSISEYFDTMMYQSENLWSADNQQATRSKLVTSLKEESFNKKGGVCVKKTFE